MPHGGGPGHPGEAVHCRCMLCEYEVELQEGQKCEAVRCPMCEGRLRSDTGIAQQKGGTRGPGRREEGDGKIPPWEPKPPPWEPKPPLVAQKECRCPTCDYYIFIEEGARCLLTDCPQCGHRMVGI